MVTKVFGTSGNDDISIPLSDPDATEGFEIRAGKGDDRVVGSSEDDVIRGGKGEEPKKRSLVEITDFELGLDQFVIAGQSDDDFMADLLAGEADATLTQNAEDLVLRLDKGLTLTFADTDMDAFMAEFSPLIVG